jgi:putative oxidoreductase
VLDRWFAGSARFAPVVIRLVLGIVFFLHGWPKMAHLTGHIDFVRGLGIPLAPVFATASALAEFLGGIALIFGLFTRYAAFFIICDMAVAIAKVHLAHGFFLRGAQAGYEYALVLLVGALSLLMSGAGPVSLDRLFGRTK